MPYLSFKNEIPNFLTFGDARILGVWDARPVARPIYKSMSRFFLEKMVTFSIFHNIHTLVKFFQRNSKQKQRLKTTTAYKCHLFVLAM